MGALQGQKAQDTFSPPSRTPPHTRRSTLVGTIDNPIVILAILVSTWLIFAFYITPRLIAHFLATRDLARSALAIKLADFFAERALQRLNITPDNIIPRLAEWAAEEANRPILNAVLINLLKTEAAGQAANLMVDTVRDKIIASLQGSLGADRKQIIDTFREAAGTEALAILEHPIVSKFLHAIQMAGTIAQLVQRGPKHE